MKRLTMSILVLILLCALSGTAYAAPEESTEETVEETVHVCSYDIFDHRVVAPTCNTTGIDRYRCVCGNTIDVEVPKLEHQWEAEYTMLEPTCTDAGKIVHRCPVCGTIEQTGTIPALGHDFQWKWYELDGNANAYKQLTCTRCGTRQGNPVYSTFTVTYVTKDQDTNAVLETSTTVVDYGTKVRGADLGKEDVVYEGRTYVYSNETIAEVHSDTTVYRLMRKRDYTVMFSSNGGDGTMPDIVFQYGKEDYIPENTFTRTGYTFKGWSKSPSGIVSYRDKELVHDLISRTVEPNRITLYTVWEANKYKVSFDVGEGIPVTPITVTYGQPYGTLPVPVWEGMTFAYWEYSEEIGEDDWSYTTIESTTIVWLTGDHTITARWNADTIKVTFVSPSKTQSMDVNAYSQVSPPFQPEETGMIFKHWSTTEDGPAFDFSAKMVRDTVLYAVFDKKTITINLQGVGSVERKYPDQIGDLPDWTSPGKVFDGWYYDADLTQPVNPTDKVKVEDFTLYPKYHDGSYTLTLTGYSNTWTMKYGDIIPTLPTPTKANSKFLYWSYKNEPVKAGESYRWSEDVKLTQVWEQKVCTVIYPDGVIREIQSGKTLGTLPTAPSKLGQSFVGYVDQFDNFVTSSTVVQQDMSIFYKYDNNNITLTLVDDTWNTKLAHDAGVQFTDLPTRSKTGYTFKGWSLSKGGVLSNGPVYQDTTLYAIYSADEQDVYLADLDRHLQRKTDSSIGSLPEAYKEGSEFLYWTYNGTEVTADTKVLAGGMTLYAKFEAVIIDVEDTVEVRFWSDGVKINTIDMPRNDTLNDPGTPALATVDSRIFMYWAERDGSATKYEFGQRVTHDLDLYAQWN